MCERGVAGRYVLCKDSSGAPCFLARLPTGAFRLAAVVATADIGVQLERFLDEGVFDRRTLIQGCVPDASAAPPRWLERPHGLLSVWVQLRDREAARLMEQAVLPECHGSHS
jgi:hypothetical protein